MTSSSQTRPSSLRKSHKLLTHRLQSRVSRVERQDKHHFPQARADAFHVDSFSFVAINRNRFIITVSVVHVNLTAAFREANLLKPQIKPFSRLDCCLTNRIQPSSRRCSSRRVKQKFSAILEHSCSPEIWSVKTTFKPRATTTWICSGGMSLSEVWLCLANHTNLNPLPRIPFSELV